MNEQIQKITEEKVEVKKKKFYQKWWFWVIVAIVGIFIISSTSESDAPNGNEKDTTIETDQASVEDYKASCNNYSYEELARNPDSYKGKKITLHGEVIQVMEDGKRVSLRVNMNSNYNQTVYITYTLKSGEGRILEDDILEIYGTFEGLFTYETVLGAELSIPHVDAKYIERVS